MSDRNPLETFRRWYDLAVAEGCERPEAMALATTGADGTPAVRIVLFRGISEGGLRFFTNYQSRKGRELLLHPQCAAVFHWSKIGRQVRVEGVAEKLADAESDAYFEARPRGHQLAAWASHQSRPLADRASLLSRWRTLEIEHQGAAIPRPAWWGGYRLIPSAVEFWAEGEHRLHERTRLERHGESWSAVLLEP